MQSGEHRTLCSASNHDVLLKAPGTLRFWTYPWCGAMVSLMDLSAFLGNAQEWRVVMAEGHHSGKHWLEWSNLSEHQLEMCLCWCDLGQTTCLCHEITGSLLQISRALGALAFNIIYSNIRALNRSEQAACTFVAQVWELHHIWLLITFSSLMQKLYDMSTLQELVVHKFSQGACKKDVKDSCWSSYRNHCLMSGAPLADDIMLCLAKLILESSERKRIVLWTMVIIWWWFPNSFLPEWLSNHTNNLHFMF
jgi:hypothetical protein